MPPPTSSLSTVGSRLSITASLSETFEPPSTTTYGRSGSSVSARSTSPRAARGHPRAGQQRGPARRRWHACGGLRRTRRRRTRHRARRADRRTAALGGVLGGLRGVEPDVLQQDDPPREAVEARAAGRPVSGKRTGSPSSSPSRVGHRREGVLRVGLAARAAQMASTTRFWRRRPAAAAGSAGWRGSARRR